MSAPVTSGTRNRLTYWCNGSYGPPMTSFECSTHATPDRGVIDTIGHVLGTKSSGVGMKKPPALVGGGFSWWA